MATPLPPFDETTEQNILGVLIAAIHEEPGLAALATTIVHPNDFYIEKNRWIFSAIMRLGEQTDMQTIAAELQAQHQLVEVGGEAYLAQLVASFYSTASLEAHLRRVADLATRRRVLDACSQTAKDAWDTTGDADGLTDRAIETFAKVNGQILACHRSMADIAQAALNDLNARIDAKGTLPGITIGIQKLDAITSGWQPGQLVTIAGRPGTGKSTLMAQAALKASQLGKHVLYFSLEMGAEEIVRRMSKAMAGVVYSNNEVHCLTTENQIKLRNALARIKQLPLSLRTEDVTVGRIVAEAELARFSGVELVVVDYLQIMALDTGERRPQTRDLELSAATRALKRLAMRLRVPVLIGSQLNRQADGIRPTLAMLRESGGIENDSDQVLMLWQPEPDEQPNLVECAIVKNRDGRTGTVNLYFEKEQHRFAFAESVSLGVI